MCGARVCVIVFMLRPVCVIIHFIQICEGGLIHWLCILTGSTIVSSRSYNWVKEYFSFIFGLLLGYVCCGMGDREV